MPKWIVIEGDETLLGEVRGDWRVCYFREHMTEGDKEKMDNEI